jgi:hypothetical protein
MNAQPDPDEFCPCCGRWVDHLDEQTGWCPPCAGSTTTGIVCNRCSRTKPSSHYSTKYWRGVCRSCQTATKNAWRAANPERDKANNEAIYARRRAARAAR